MNATYILPIKRDTSEVNAELTGYLRRLSAMLEVIVVDGSKGTVFDAHARLWGGFVEHIAPDPALNTANGKVAGVLSGVRRASYDRLIIADEDVRYDAAGITRAIALLNEADVVRPQNYFSALPWHAKWDTARTLLNRVTGGDWPGTFAVWRPALERTSGYAGDVLFENLEMVRTICAAGGRELVAYDLFVPRLPPSSRQFFSQRVRQAYDELARPSRFFSSLAAGPLLALAMRRRWFTVIAGGAAGLICAAEVGRRRAGGAQFFPIASSLLAPAWLLERIACSWIAIASLLVFRGISYRGVRLRRAATPMHVLRERYRRKSAP